jgi:CRISPR-associated protein Cas2
MRDDRLAYVVCYDIRDDQRRTRVAACLDGFGGRVQWSVFEALLTRELLDDLVTRVGEIINPKLDRVSIYPLCAACRKKTVLN